MKPRLIRPMLIVALIAVGAVTEVSAQGDNLEYKLIDPKTHEVKGRLKIGDQNTAEVEGKSYLIEAVEPMVKPIVLKAQQILIGPLHVKDMPLAEFVLLLNQRSLQRDPAFKKTPDRAGVPIALAAPPPSQSAMTKVSFDFVASTSLFDALRYTALAANCELVFEDHAVKLNAK